MQAIKWIIAAIFLLSGIAKLVGLDFEVNAFSRWGYPIWFMYFIGGLETAGGLALLHKRSSAYAAAALTVVMLGAVVTHVRHAEWSMMVVAFIITGLSAFVAAKGKFCAIKTANTSQNP